MQTPDFQRDAERIEENKEKFSRFFALLKEYNEKFNLTAITEERDVYHKHFLDSLAGEAFLPQGAELAEVGSGAGFPSIPLAIVRADLRFTLIESISKKCEFLKVVKEELALSNLRILCSRAEAVAGGQERERFDGCIARAVAPLNVLSEYCLPLVRVKGFFLAYKGAPEGEIDGARRAISLLGGGTAQVLKYRLPADYGERALVYIRKERPTPQKYPRGGGKERKNPL